jgi:glycosyltransferase involved in cell wall biosynthesis
VIFVHSEVDRVELGRAFETRAPVEVVPHGTGQPDITPVPDEPVMLFFGRLVEYKGLDVLLDALPLIWKRIPDARLIIAGAGELPSHRLLGDPRTISVTGTSARRTCPRCSSRHDASCFRISRRVRVASGRRQRCTGVPWS